MAKWIVKTVSVMLTALFLLIVSFGEYPQKDSYYEPVSVKTYVLWDALMRAQGITTDGEYYYFSTNLCLTKTKADTETVVAQNLLAIPAKLMKLGCSHIGGISYAGGKIYATIEDSKVFEHLYLAVYDAQTLTCIGYRALPPEYHENGAPWCVADAENGCIYSARRDHIEELAVYDMETLAFIRTIPLDATAHKIQGGEMYKGILYLSASREAQSVFAINPSTGEVQIAFERNLTKGTEGEDLTILPWADGSLFHVLDIGAVRVGVHLRSYDFNTESLTWKTE